MEAEGQDKRPLQNFTNLPHNLTEEVWHSLWNAGYESKCECLMDHCFAIGLRCPDARTIAVMCSLLHLQDGKQMDRPALYYKGRKLADQFKKLRKSKESLYGRLMEVVVFLEPNSCCDVVPWINSSKLFSLSFDDFPLRYDQKLHQRPNLSHHRCLLRLIR